MHYLTFCCIAKDEDFFLKEWLAYHATLGVEHFYIYDNCSVVPIRQLLDEFADPSRVTIRRVPGERMQLPVYDDCLQSFGASCKWIGFLDVDEFALPMQDNDLRVMLSEFEDYGGLGATWHLFGPSGHLKRPKGLVTRNYTKAFAAQKSFQIKTFAQPARTAQCLNPHYFRYQPGYYCVNEEHYPVSPGLQCTFTPGGRIRVNHYFMKSQQDFEHKIQRGGGARTKAEDWHSMDGFYDGAARACVTDETIFRFLPPVEKALRENRLPQPRPLLPAGVPGEELMETALAFLEAGQPEKTLAVLCHGNPAHTAKPGFWTLRAMAASALNQPGRAEIFIRQALLREPTRTAYAHLRSLLANTGRDDLAAGITTILSRYPGMFS